MTPTKTLIAAIAALGVSAAPAIAGETLFAVAANFTAPAKEIGAAFTAKTGETVTFSFGSTGKLYAQITQGAPFDGLLAADDAHPLRAEREGYAVAGSSFTYAVGKLVLWSRVPGLVDDQGAVLKSGGFNKLANTNPSAAPYGAAAVEAMTALAVLDALKPKIVEGNNLSQVYQFVSTGNAELGFIALSQVKLDPVGSHWVVPQHLYRPIHQGAALLAKGAANPTASAFLAFLKSPESRAILEKYGYGVGNAGGAR